MKEEQSEQMSGCEEQEGVTLVSGLGCKKARHLGIASLSADSTLLELGHSHRKGGTSQILSEDSKPLSPSML